MINVKNSLIKDIIFIVPHHLNCLKYFDKIYYHLINNNIEVVYIFGRKLKMEKYCRDNGRKYENLHIEIYDKLVKILDPFIKYKIKRKIKKIFKKYHPKLILQYNDVLSVNDIIVKIAKRFKIMTLVWQWALTSPEEIDFTYREIKRQKILSNLKESNLLIRKFISKILYIIHYPLYLFFGVYTNHKLSFGQGDSDILGVINNYSKNLFVKQGINEKKIRVIGLLHYDDALKAKNKSIEDLTKKYNIDEFKTCIVYFSQPFYTKDIFILTLEKQLNYIEDLLTNINNFYKNRKKDYELIIKLHPVEDIKDYNRYFNKMNVHIISDADINELILISDICISQHSTVLQSVIVLNKPVISLNILGLSAIKLISKGLGIKRCVNTWEEFTENLEKLENNEYSLVDNVNYDYVIIDGKCYLRTINLIKKLIRRTKLRAY